ncbi:MAG TPA: hypothetical protein GX708_24725 [Gallicola sp.]|nr:hypothetical protein [Gallicola sp.]
MFNNNFTIIKRSYNLELNSGTEKVTKHIITAPWCVPAVFVGDTEQEANDFIKGFNREPITEQNEAYLEGLNYKECLEMSI